MERLKKDELIKLIKTLKIDKEEFWVLSSGNLTLRGIMQDAGDLDIGVTYKGLEQLKQNYNLKEKGNDWYQVTDQIEAVCDGNKEDLKYELEKIDDIYVQNINEYLEYLYQSKRPKDKERIEIVKKYIKEKNFFDD